MLAAYLILFFRNPKDLPACVQWGEEGQPSVSIIVPARNEEENIQRCVTSLSSLEYPAFEILVVDDQSRDRTAEVVEALPPGNATDLRIIRGKPPPAGWFGKPWACWQGAEVAIGDLLLFTDADTVHSPDLLCQAVNGLIEDGADVVTVIGRQIMASFWEQLLQPQFFMLLAARYPRAGTPKEPHQWKHAIANGQYLLFKREAYDASGGHVSVAGEVVEDLRFAQLLSRGGWKLVMRKGEGLQTRMYRSLAGLVEGWSKNITTAVLQTTAPRLLPIILPLSWVVGATLWVLPPVTFTWALVTGRGGPWLLWGGLTTGVSLITWCRVSAMMKGNPVFGLLYPLGSLLAQFIFLKSWWRGTEIVWKGRRYDMSQEMRTSPPSVSGFGESEPPGPSFPGKEP
jgi:chlorobactene glucosyltransferase